MHKIAKVRSRIGGCCYLGSDQCHPQGTEQWCTPECSPYRAVRVRAIAWNHVPICV